MRRFTLLGLSIILLAFSSGQAMGQYETGVLPAPPGEVDPEIKRIQDEAEVHYQAAFKDLSDNEYLKTAEIVEDLIKNYSYDQYVEDAYFYLADIYSGRLQGAQYNREAIRVLDQFLNDHPGSPKCLDALILKAVIAYRALNDINLAITTLNVYFNQLPLHDYLESEKLQAQLLMARCFQKSGDFGKEKVAWDGILIGNQSADTTGRYRFLNDIANWKRLTGSGVTLYFHSGVSEKNYAATLASSEKELAKLVTMFGPTPPRPLEIYLYNNPDDLGTYVSQPDPLVSDTDFEIHLAPIQSDQMPYLVAQAYSIALNQRAKDERHPLMKGGLDMAFYENKAGDNIDRIAARYLLLFKESPGASLFVRGSTFFGSSEYGSLAGSFCGWLLETTPTDVFAKLYRGLYPTHDAEDMDAIFKRYYGASLDDLVGEWYDSLGVEMADIRATSPGSYDLTPVKVDLSSPDATLKTWYEALRKGDFDVLMAASVPDLRKLFKEAKDAYVTQGIFDEVIIVEFVYPYYDTTFTVSNHGPLGDDVYIFNIDILKDDKVIEQKNIPLRRMKGKWYVDMNP